MKVGDMAIMCHCLSDRSQSNLTVKNEDDTCVLCGYYVIERPLEKCDINRFKRQEKSFDKVFADYRADGIGTFYEKQDEFGNVIKRKRGAKPKNKAAISQQK